ncbi:hypothetical protein GCM10009639_20870 [Kitasatospora putterlickiae]|uniref:ATP-binding protein n=1 Tax=Kitasatospora putterlickiae TaxID=221725 RepID=A0ABN1XY15_9ACTN
MLYGTRISTPPTSRAPDGSAAVFSGAYWPHMTKYGAVRRPLPTSPFAPRPEAPRKHFAAGDRVNHDRYGLGRVVSVEETADAAALVDFGSHQERIVQPYTAMCKL